MNNVYQHGSFFVLPPIGSTKSSSIESPSRNVTGIGEAEWVILVERPETNGVKYDYYVSNVPFGTRSPEFAGVILGLHRVEDCFRRAKDACGLAEYGYFSL